MCSSDLFVLAGLLKSLPGRCLGKGVRNSVLLHSAVRDLPLAFIKPTGFSGSTREEPETKKSDSGSQHAFNDEKPMTESDKNACWALEGFVPSPAGNSTSVVEAGKYSCSNEAREPCCKNLGAVQHGDASSDLCRPISIVLSPIHAT